MSLIKYDTKEFDFKEKVFFWLVVFHVSGHNWFVSLLFGLKYQSKWWNEMVKEICSRT